jgi:DNA-binding NarL/FixJ family response regulator
MGEGYEKIAVLLVDDHAIVREGTRELLEREPDIEIAGEAQDGEEAVLMALQTRPKVILMDISMPKINGIEATRIIKQKLPEAAILVFTAYDEDPYIFALLNAGAAGYLLKNVRSAELVRAIRAVASGESVLHPSVVRRLISRVAQKAPTSPDVLPNPLSDREVQVITLAGRGLGNKEIAADLSISPRTVQVHLANIFSKLGVGSRTEAVLCTLKNGWVSLADLQDDPGSGR